MTDYEAALRAELLDDESQHPLTVLGTWVVMIAQDYGDELPLKLDLSWAAAYLDRKLTKVAQDDTQDFPLMRREMRACRSHLEAVLHNSTRLERGAPCPDCQPAAFVRLQHEYGHYCDDADCERIHYADDTGDRWVCPRNREHVWTEKAYRDYIEERTA